MFVAYDDKVYFDSDEDFPHATQSFWLNPAMLDEVLTWARNTQTDMSYLNVRNAMTARYRVCAFAFRTEAEFSMFNITFLERLIEDQKTTPVYRLYAVMADMEVKLGKKIF
jgi:hypothetical protein